MSVLIIFKGRSKMKEYTVRFHFDLYDREIDDVGHIVALNTEDLHSKMSPFRYEIIGARIFNDRV